MTVLARTRFLSPDNSYDLNAVAAGDGFLFAQDAQGVAGRGIAARVSADEARNFLELIDVDDEVAAPGSGPLLFGAIPFLPGAPHEFILPKVVIVRDPSGASWVTTIDDSTLDELDCADSPASILTPSFHVRPGILISHYLAAVEAARAAVGRGDLDKVVIARDVVITSSEPIDIAALTNRLRQSFGSSYRYLFDGLVGASPELLIERRGSSVRSHPLAGTTPRTGNPATDEQLARDLLGSEKNQIEHRIVIDMVHDTLLPYCSYLDWEAEPSVVPVANVQHLGTLMSGMLSEPFLHVLDGATMLSPTPALGGAPREVALDLIARHEGIDRGRYGGAVGWFDRHGNGTFAVTIRCAEITPDRLRAQLFAGGGIVAESEPLAELAETQAKLQAMLAAIVRP
jgi:menaquinone-specific isochorismate synthase